MKGELLKYTTLLTEKTPIRPFQTASCSIRLAKPNSDPFEVLEKDPGSLELARTFPFGLLDDVGNPLDNCFNMSSKLHLPMASRRFTKGTGSCRLDTVENNNTAAIQEGDWEHVCSNKGKESWGIPKG